MDNLISVSPNMLFTNGVCFEGLLAIRTEERPGIAVTGFMTIERTPRSEAAVALGAREVWRRYPFVR